MVRFGAVSEVLVNCTDDSSEAEYGLDESPVTCGAKTMRGRCSFYSNASDDAWNFAFDSSTDSSPMSGEIRIVVKNTFIDGYTHEDHDAEDADAGPPVAAAKSCPVLLGRTVLPPDMLPRKPTRARTVQVLQADTEAEMDSLAVVTDGQLPYEPPAAPAPPAAFAGVEEHPQLGQGASQAVVALDAREPLMSAGSALHELGECRPCAWYWRPQGCENGQDCRHCHLCPQGALKERRRSKMSSARQQERAVWALPNGEAPMAFNAGRLQLALGSLI